MEALKVGIMENSKEYYCGLKNSAVYCRLYLKQCKNPRKVLSRAQGHIHVKLTLTQLTEL